LEADRSPKGACAGGRGRVESAAVEVGRSAEGRDRKEGEGDEKEEEDDEEEEEEEEVEEENPLDKGNASEGVGVTTGVGFEDGLMRASECLEGFGSFFLSIFFA
jgi:hypothetical protein